MSLAAELEALPKDKRFWVVGAVIAGVFLLSGALNKKPSADQSSSAGFTPQDLLAFLRAQAQTESGIATAGISAGGAIAQSGLDVGGSIANRALGLAGQSVDISGQVAIEANRNMGRSLETTLRTLSDLASSITSSFSRLQPSPVTSPTPTPAPVAPVGSTGSPVPVGAPSGGSTSAAVPLMSRDLPAGSVEVIPPRGGSGEVVLEPIGRNATDYAGTGPSNLPVRETLPTASMADFLRGFGYTGPVSAAA